MNNATITVAALTNASTRAFFAGLGLGPEALLVVSSGGEAVGGETLCGRGRMSYTPTLPVAREIDAGAYSPVCYTSSREPDQLHGSWCEYGYSRSYWRVIS